MDTWKVVLNLKTRTFGLYTLKNIGLFQPKFGSIMDFIGLKNVQFKVKVEVGLTF